MSWIFKDEPSTPPDPKAARKRVLLLASPFAVLGTVALVMFLHDELIGGMPRQKVIATLSFIATCAGFVALIIGINAKKMAMSAASPKSAPPEAPEKPWLKRADWAAGKIKSAGIPHAKSYLTMGIALCVLGGLIAVLVVPKALRSGNYSALVAVVFPVVGIVFLTMVVRKFQAHRRFGDCVFEMTAVPAPVGGALEGFSNRGPTCRNPNPAAGFPFISNCRPASPNVPSAATKPSAGGSK
jgi:hypothetical protein